MQEGYAVIIKNTFGLLLNEHLKELWRFGCFAIVDGKVYFGETDGLQKSIPIEL
jgi:hypothetical protein